jgi:hypothetical protein
MTINDLLCLGIGMAEDQKTYLLEKLTKRKRMQHNKNYLLFFMEFHKKQKIIRSVVRFFSLTFKGKRA